MLVVVPEDDNATHNNDPVDDKDTHNESHIFQEPECSQLSAPFNVTTTATIVHLRSQIDWHTIGIL